MLRLLADENLNGDILRGYLLHEPNANIIRVQDIGFSNTDDPDILEWAAQDDRILVTHDRASIMPFVKDRLLAKEKMPGVFILKTNIAAGRAIDELILLNQCSEPSEWVDQVIYLPL